MISDEQIKQALEDAGVGFQYFTHARFNKQVCTTEGSVSFDLIAKGVRALIALAQEVKPLEWAFLDHYKTWIARGLDYDYVIPVAGDCFHLHYGDDVLCSSNSIEGLKEAANADFRKRVLSCLVNGGA